MSILTKQAVLLSEMEAVLAENSTKKRASETIDLLLTRRSVVAAKQCEPGPTNEELDILLRCATRVPDHAKLTPWRIQVVQGDARERLGNLFATVFRENNPDASEEKIAFEYQRPLRSPLMLIVSTKINTESIPRWEQILSGGAVCQNILVAATALGYASQWLSEWPNYDETIKSTLGIDPTDEILGFMYIGSATETPKERPRPALEDVVEYL
ncbi:MAG: nitroreductase [Chloroflexota bacterium]